VRKGQLAGFELHHRRRARCQDRIPRRQGHRAAQPAAEGLRRTRCGARSSRCLLAARLDADAGPGRRLPSAGAEAHLPARPRRPQPPCIHRPLAAVPRTSPLLSPACKPSRAAAQPEQSTTREGKLQTSWNPAHPARQPGRRHDRHQKTNPTEHLRPPHPSHERSGVNPLFNGFSQAKTT
jgi:hypothetical protein